MDEETLDITKSVIEHVGKDIYIDTFQPGAKKLGQTLLAIATTIDTVAMPIYGINWTGERVKEWLVKNVAERLKGISEEKLVNPSPQVFMQALNGISICFEEEVLREMYANLIAATCCEDLATGTHPSYPGIIQQLTSSEAKLLTYLFENHPTGRIFDKSIDENEFSESGGYIYSEIIEGQLAAKNPDLLKETNIYSAMDNLQRLRIISASTETYSEYMEPRAEKYEIISACVKNSFHVQIIFTDLGIGFAECCIKTSIQ